MSPIVLEQIFVNFKYLCTLRKAFDWKIIVARRLSLKDFISVRYHALKNRRKSERSSRLNGRQLRHWAFRQNSSHQVLSTRLANPPKLKVTLSCDVHVRESSLWWDSEIFHKKCVSMKTFRETWLNDNHGLKNSHRDGFCWLLISLLWVIITS